MQLVIELLLWFIIEVVFWGILFWTGYAITSILTFGKWKILIDDNGKKQRKEPKFIITALIGILFWLGLVILLTITIQLS